MELKDMISRRKSVRAYTGEPVSEAQLHEIRAIMDTLTPLVPGIRAKGEIVTREQVRCFLPWTTPQLIAIYSEDHPAAMENAGFLFQQLDLHLQRMGLGVCWLGMGRMDPKELQREDGLRYVIMLAFGHPRGDALRSSLAEFKRKPLSSISDREDPRLEPARLAPSSVNSQPWYFVHEGETVHVYCAHQGLFRVKSLSEMNRIDIGIALAHLYVSEPEHFRFFTVPDAAHLRGHSYIGSITF